MRCGGWVIGWSSELIGHLETQRGERVSTSGRARRWTAVRGAVYATTPRRSTRSCGWCAGMCWRPSRRSTIRGLFAFVPGPRELRRRPWRIAGGRVQRLCRTLAGWLGAGGGGAAAIDWLCRECGLPATAGGLLRSGGSMANLTALATARRVKAGGPDRRRSSIVPARRTTRCAKGCA